MSLYYGSHSRFYVSVDCIIFGLKDGKLSILLTRRAFEPEKGKWSLMGGFVRPDESVAAAAERGECSTHSGARAVRTDGTS